MPCGEPFRFSHLPREIAAASPEEQQALLERNARDIEDFISDWPCAGDDVAAFLFAPDMGGTVNSEDFEPAFEIIAETGGDFSVAGNVITVPSQGLYVWRKCIYWWTYPSLSGGSDGVSYGGWYSEVACSGSYTDNLSLTPFTKNGSSPAGFRYFTNAGIVGAYPTVTVLGGPQFYSYASVSGTTTWDMYFTLAKVSSLQDTVPT